MRRRVRVLGFDAATQQWRAVDVDTSAPTPDEWSAATYNIWFNELHAAQRFQAIADVLHRKQPDVMVFQEVTDLALTTFLAQPWIRAEYRAAAVSRGNYGMLLLTRLPVAAVTYTRLPTRLNRGVLRADIAGCAVCSVHLESGKSSSRLRARQLRIVFRALRRADDVVLMGDFNMRDGENSRIAAPYVDVWPALRGDEPGFTEDTSINLMRFDMKNKHRHVRFDRVLLKGHRWAASDIDLLGTEPIHVDLPRIFPSDHFGVLCTLVRSAAAHAPE